MLVLIGFAIVFGSILLGYTMHHGHLGVLLQTSEFIIIGGAALGAVLIGNPPAVVRAIFKRVLDLVRGNPYRKSAFVELLLMLFDLFQLAKREGLLALEEHAERPQKSELFKKAPTFLASREATSFLADTLKVLLTGNVDRYDLAEILDLDLERMHESSMAVPNALAKVGDAMPGFGIVAAVLGVVITMGSIGGAAADIGKKVAAALVGTFLGVLLAYGVFHPLAQACESVTRSQDEYLRCIKSAILSFARGDAPLIAVEFARRNIDPEHRPSFAEIEAAINERKRAS